MTIEFAEPHKNVEIKNVKNKKCWKQNIQLVKNVKNKKN